MPIKSQLIAALVVAGALAVSGCNGGSGNGGGGGNGNGLPLDPNGETFTFLPPGDLVSGSGEGRVDDTIYAPGIRFPLENAPSYPNSQVYGVGGSQGPSGGQCNEANYSYPWRDNYCESRSWTMPLCPAGRGHQGVDIRPATCEKSVYFAVAVEDGVISGIGSYSVTLIGDSGTIYRYLHLDMSQLSVSIGDDVTRGQRIGLVSNDFAGTPTTIHLHFDMRQAVTLEDGDSIITYVPPYASLVPAYEDLLRGNP